LRNLNKGGEYEKGETFYPVVCSGRDFFVGVWHRLGKETGMPGWVGRNMGWGCEQ
jgi:hypothetical protein